METFRIILVLVLVVGLVYFGYVWRQEQSQPKTNPVTTTNLTDGQLVSATLGNKTLNIKIVSKPTSLTKGLMGVTEFSEFDGMFFVFPYNAKHGIWMLNMKIPIDILWLNEDLEIIHIEKNVQPCIYDSSKKSFCIVYKPKTESRYVLELPANFSDQNNLDLGQILQIAN